MRRTIKEQQAANSRGSILLGILLMLVLAVLGASIMAFYDPSSWMIGGIGAGVLGFVLALIAWSAGSSIVLGISGAREANRIEDQVLDNVVEEMAIAAGIPKPKIYVIDDSSPNAFATGSGPQNGVVCVTTGLIGKLTREELQGVIAHEIGHIRNLDIKFMTTIALVAGAIPMIADIFLRTAWWSGGSRRSRDNDNSVGNVLAILSIVFAVLAPIFAVLIKLAVSRKREYLADATAAELTRNPDGLASALIKISNDPDPLDRANRATEHMYIVDPFKKNMRSYVGDPTQMMNLDSEGPALLSTHPPIADRVRALRGLMGQRQRPDIA